MEATMQNVIVTLPSSDMKFFKEIIKKMGWTIEKSKKSKTTANATTLAAIKEAYTKEAAGTIDTGSYDSFVKSILE